MLLRILSADFHAFHQNDLERDQNFTGRFETKGTCYLRRSPDEPPKASGRQYSTQRSRARSNFSIQKPHRLQNGQCKQKLFFLNFFFDMSHTENSAGSRDRKTDSATAGKWDSLQNRLSIRNIQNTRRNLSISKRIATPRK